MMVDEFIKATSFLCLSFIKQKTSNEKREQLNCHQCLLESKKDKKIFGEEAKRRCIISRIDLFIRRTMTQVAMQLLKESSKSSWAVVAVGAIYLCSLYCFDLISNILLVQFCLERIQFQFLNLYMIEQCSMSFYNACIIEKCDSNIYHSTIEKHYSI